MDRRWIAFIDLRVILVVALAWTLSPAPATAGPASRTYEYFVHHQIHGLIGRHRMTVTSDGEAAAVEHRLNIAVKYLFMVVYRRDAFYRETWRDGRLIAFDARIDDNGELGEVRAQAEGDHLMIHTPRGTIEAPGNAAPAQPSLEAALDGGWFFENETGQLEQGDVGSPVADQVLVGGRAMPASRYRIHGLDYDVWYDRAGVFLKMQLERGGGTVTMIRDQRAG